MQNHIRPTPFVYLSSAMLVVPALAIVGASMIELVAVFRGIPLARGEAALLLFSVPALLLLIAEYAVIRRGSSTAASCIASVCLVLSMLGLLGLVFGMAADRSTRSWLDFLTPIAVLAYFAIAGLGHHRWVLRLSASEKQVGPSSAPSLRDGHSETG